MGTGEDDVRKMFFPKDKKLDKEERLSADN